MVFPGGLERMTFEILRVLREPGAEVHCILNDWENYRIFPLAEGIGATWSAGHYWYRLDRHTRNPIKLTIMAVNLLRSSVGLMLAVRQFQPTHIFMPDFGAVLRYGSALIPLRLFGYPIVLRLGEAPNPDRFYRRLWRWIINPLVDRFVCNSKFTQQQLLAHGISAKKVSYIYNTVPARRDQIPADIERDSAKVIYVGQIIPEKGLDLLLDAIGILANRQYDVRLDIAGQIEGWGAPAYAGHREQLLARAEQPDLHGRVRFLGWREDVPALLAGAAIHCCPSRPEIREGFGVVNIEAKQAGLPSVVFATGALPELITHRVDGWVCLEVSAQALAEGLEYFLSDPARLAEAGRRARASLERFSHKQFAEKWRSVFVPAVATSSKPDPIVRSISGGVQT
jgi:glycosyltransferase involved in cell wall biosynthesis